MPAAVFLMTLGACQSAGTSAQPVEFASTGIPSIRSEIAAAPGEFWRDIKGTFTSKHNLFLLGGAFAAAEAADALGFADGIHEEIQSEREVDLGQTLNDTLQGAGDGAFLVAVALGFWGYGHASGNVRTHEVGSRAIAALAATGLITQVIKTIVPEKRPNGGNGSFPSGHSSMAFAFADTMRRSYGWKVGVPLYIIASGVALQRLDASYHELEDVVVGAALGLAVSRTVHLRRGEEEQAVLSIGPYVNDASGAVGLSVSLQF
ncbi:PAP2 superfamily protein [Planctomycetes bacterium Poly30]|uniref:PAP2 superfamily protein n=1 Tax=Saltatorellus ferox TaxID=2528018 RepID=A0A518EYI0_9BACT|nr:PAP2 superfamily protein [Planctomycetes bacterium Poly30]